jgi:hypothetical protein
LNSCRALLTSVARELVRSSVARGLWRNRAALKSPGPRGLGPCSAKGFDRASRCRLRPRCALRAAPGAAQKTYCGTARSAARESRRSVRRSRSCPERARPKSAAIPGCRKSRSAHIEDCAAARLARGTALRTRRSATAKFPRAQTDGPAPTGVSTAAHSLHDRPGT